MRCVLLGKQVVREPDRRSLEVPPPTSVTYISLHNGPNLSFKMDNINRKRETMGLNALQKASATDYFLSRDLRLQDG